MVWAFILGILVGKGYRPENAIPEIAQIMPEKQQVEPKQPRVLKAEELDYYDRLKKSKPQPAPPKAQTTRPVPPIQTRRQAPPAPTQQRFAYIYQAAAFQSQADAIRFQQQIIRRGIPAFIEHAPSGWYRVNVRFKGTPSETAHLKAQLKALGVAKPLLKSKKPV
jgi:cell division septation protein DedD